MRPTNARIWHKAVFKVGRVAGPKPTRVRQGQKYLRPRRHSLLGAPQAPGNKPNPPKGVKAWGYGPLRPEEISSAEAHPAEPPRGKTAYRMQPKNWRGKATQNALERPQEPLYLSLRPTNTRIWHKAVFKVGPVAGPKPTRVRQGQKYLRPRRHSPFWGASGARQ